MFPHFNFYLDNDASVTLIPQDAYHVRQRICAGIAMLQFVSPIIFSEKSGSHNLNRHLIRLALALLISQFLSFDASAETVAETVSKWGLIGSWSLDCSLAPDPNKGAVLAYEIAKSGRVLYRRNFGKTQDKGEVLRGETSADGSLHLRVFFPTLRETREYGLMMQPDGTVRAIYNRNLKKQYTIKDGKFVSNGTPTPAQHKCG